MTVTFTQPLRERMRLLRINAGAKQETLGAALGVQAHTVGRWERGAAAPNVHQAIAYVAFFEHRLVVHRRGLVVADLPALLPDLAGFRERLRLTKVEAGRRMQMTSHGVGSMEKRLARGDGVLLPGVERYLYALDADIAITPAKAVTTC